MTTKSVTTLEILQARAARPNGIKINRKVSKRTPEQLFNALQLRHGGMSYANIAKIVGFSSDTVQRWLDPEYNERRNARFRKPGPTHRSCEVSADKRARKMEAEALYEKYIANHPSRRPSVAYVRCLEGKEPPTFQMVRP
jgi:hypothetical protein